MEKRKSLRFSVFSEETLAWRCYTHVIVDSTPEEDCPPHLPSLLGAPGGGLQTLLKSESVVKIKRVEAEGKLQDIKF